ncbi:flagellar protein FliS [bacterium]|nr:flagellar protein FliS [bacterium]
MTGKQATYNPTRNPYYLQQVKSASPQKIILMLYELGLKGCRAKDRDLASKVLVELIAALDFQYQEIALPLFDQYRFALDLVHRDKFDYPSTMFQELRDVWKANISG